MHLAVCGRIQRKTSYVTSLCWRSWHCGRNYVCSTHRTYWLHCYCLCKTQQQFSGVWFKPLERGTFKKIIYGSNQTEGLKTRTTIFWNASLHASYWVIIAVLPQKINTGYCTLKLEGVQCTRGYEASYCQRNKITSYPLKPQTRGVHIGL